jgi:hypothetical protein
MTPTASRSGLGYEFDDFLFAVIGDDRNGMPLRVVSVLARADLDPWHEADILAALPEELAARRLAPLLATLPQLALQQTSASTTAVRLVALLPRRLNANASVAAQEAGAASVVHPRTLLGPIFITIYLILSLGIQYCGARRDVEVRTNTARVPSGPIAPSLRPQ